MTMKEAVIAFWMKGFDFSGRARRSEVWLNILANVIIGFLIGMLSLVIDAVTGWRLHIAEHFSFFMETIFPSVVLIPGMAQASRRLHDINLDGRIAIVITVASALIDFAVKHKSFFPLNFEKSGVMIIFSVILGIGGFCLFIVNFIKGHTGANQYGPDPKVI
ncbi:DUF805 domain-containing protein [Macrococcus brunensis]|uniref:DUF805 domain-containing protein n=1 Tax=Macrococcus brunensis TaxID=198483 RepID=A0A4R6BEN6_9STAP|nr:DUF805 domain-containing protein [Macrococcus brunensis]TDL98242.1 DUF805 domain-containing protein [Macrococcus brunensis]